MSDEISWYDNVYNDPEKFGLEIVNEIGEYGYDWSLLVVWRRLSDGALFWDTDAGCSCNSGWSGVQNVSDLRELNSKTWSEFEQGVREFSDYYATAAEKVKLLSEASALVGR